MNLYFQWLSTVGYLLESLGTSKKNQKTKTKKQFSGFTPGDSDLIAMEWDSDDGIFQKHPRSISHAVKIKNHWYV